MIGGVRSIKIGVLAKVLIITWVCHVMMHCFRPINIDVLATLLSTVSAQRGEERTAQRMREQSMVRERERQSEREEERDRERHSEHKTQFSPFGSFLLWHLCRLACIIRSGCWPIRSPLQATQARNYIISMRHPGKQFQSLACGVFASLVDGLVGFPIDLNVRRTCARGWEMMPLHRIVFRRSCADLVRGYLEVN